MDFVSLDAIGHKLICGSWHTAWHVTRALMPKLNRSKFYQALKV